MNPHVKLSFHVSGLAASQWHSQLYSQILVVTKQAPV